MRAFSRRWTGWRASKSWFLWLPALLLIFYLYFWRLGTLTAGFSHAEITARQSSASFSALKNNPLNLPHKLVQLLFQSVGHHGAFWMRGASVFFALLFIAAIFLLLKKWFGNFIAFLGGVLFAVTPWIVMVSRSASSDVMLLSTILVILAYVSLTRSAINNKREWILLLLSLALAIYTSGVIWFLLLGFIFSRKQILAKIRQLSRIEVASGAIILIVLILPLLYGFYEHHFLLRNWLLVPQTLPNALHFIKNVALVVATLVFKSPQHSDYIVGRLGAISVAQSILALYGIYAMNRSAHREMAILLSLIFIGILAASLNGNLALLTLCLPAIAVFDSAALRLLYVRWMHTFPLNPLPRTFALTLIFILMLSQVAYGLRYSLAAWPHSVDTRNTYMLK